MFRWLIESDKEIFLFLNGLHNPVWDGIMWWISQTRSWIPLYVVLLIALIYKERSYRLIFILLFVALTVVLCDQISVLIKNLVERPRPTHHPEIADIVHFVKRRGGQFGFVSSHAANVFGVAAFLASQFKHYRWSLFLFAWAVVVSYSRIYLGVHYPLDIICGAMLGILIGNLCYAYKVKVTAYAERQTDIRKEKKAAKRKAAEAGKE